MGAFDFFCGHSGLFELFHVHSTSGCTGRGAVSFFMGAVSRLALLFLFGLLLRQNYERFLALLERYRHAVYAAAAVTGCFIVAVSYFGQDIAVTSKRPDILLYSTSIIFLCFHLFSKLKSVPKLIMMISNYSFSIYLLHAFILIFGLVILTSFESIGTVSAVLLLFRSLQALRFSYLGL